MLYMCMDGMCGCGHKRNERRRREKNKEKEKIKENNVIVLLCVYILEQHVHSRVCVISCVRLCSRLPVNRLSLHMCA